MILKIGLIILIVDFCIAILYFGITFIRFMFSFWKQKRVENRIYQKEIERITRNKGLHLTYTVNRLTEDKYPEYEIEVSYRSLCEHYPYEDRDILIKVLERLGEERGIFDMGKSKPELGLYVYRGIKQ